MIETIKDMKHGKAYQSPTLEKTASQILHHIEDKNSEDSLEATRARVLANARAIYGSTRQLDVISFAPSSSRKIGAAIVEHNPTGRSYIHCSSAKEDSRLAAVEHLLVITEDIIQRLLDTEGITCSGWLPATAQAQHAAQFHAASPPGGSIAGSAVPAPSIASIAGSVSASRRSSVQPSEHNPIDPYHAALSNLNPLSNSVQIYQKPTLARRTSDISHQPHESQQPMAVIPRTSSEVIAQPRPMQGGMFQGHRHGRVQWNLGSEG
ncbi:hypothetical protein K491DRAFT_764198 [Lophiostoma macrostomum CBS 122681]|uniref:Uncharacterized protein n=1 Tax=Lophiostoma macrostomum CBS 122681 TaxID=1314788 RepID=A0A6A6TUX6_9PLEO|nr:hypothetical protein K491DRAFT_764198 [Lophiostoma macrostomum CBS 122681]